MKPNFNDQRLPDGSPFAFWERPQTFTKAYYVDGKAPHADDDGPGTQEHPFRTINRAAQALQPGERVVIAEGVYRESIHPARGGEGPERMISYEAAPGAKVIVKGSVALQEGWRPSTGWALRRTTDTETNTGNRQLGVSGEPRVWEFRFDGALFGGYNPFGMANVLHDRYWLFVKRINMTPFFRRRGMIFCDGLPLQQVDLYRELAEAPGRFWIEHQGTTIHVRLPDDDDPADHLIEATVKEQVFAPAERYQGYIRLKGITFEHAGNGFPVPQRGLVSANRGHHFIIEDCTIQWANALGLDLGAECWNSEIDGPIGEHVVRRNTIRQCGICGLAAFRAPSLLIEDNLFEHCGWQNAEHMYESGGVKLHVARDLLFRRNVLRHMVHAPGLWLDCTNVNCRIAGNVFADIQSRAGGIHFEGTHEANQVDHNLFWGMKADITLDGEYGAGGHAILVEGSDKVLFAHNLVMNCENCGFDSTAVVPNRIIDGRGGACRAERVYHNLFVNCGKAAVHFANEHNAADGNLYANVRGGYLRLDLPGRPQLLDLAAWREFYGWDTHGATGRAALAFDPDALTLTLSVAGEVPAVAAPDGLEIDFMGQCAEGNRAPGPFAGGLDVQDLAVDPRQI